MKYKVLLCLLWELTTPVPMEGRLADDLCFQFILTSNIYSAVSVYVESFVIRYSFLKWTFQT